MPQPVDTTERAPFLAARIPNRPLTATPVETIWPVSGEVRRVDIEGAEGAADGRSLFVSIETDARSDTGVDTLAFDAYRRLLQGVARAGYPHFIRIWNYVPRIHEGSPGIDRYMLFCKGRAEAFATLCGDQFPERLSAASAVGCPGDTLIVHALASREPVRHVENPRQVSAYRYPERYGPKSPSFARATVGLGAWNGAVFVSGTASIVGYESVFPGDPARQTAETMRNIESVLDAAGVPGRGGPLGPRLTSLRVYVRFPAQQPAIRETIEAFTGTTVPTTWLQAEICREELLVEIEATARAAPGQSGADTDLRPTVLARKD
jgi:chorismate lyase/3-hydroxybenzoate synthase